MSPEERTQRDLAAFYRRPLPDSQIAAVAEERADLIALEGLSAAEAERLRRLCRGEG